MPVAIRTLPLLAALLAVSCVAATQASAKPRANASERTLKAVDKDADGTIDLGEAQRAASALFDKLDRDKEGTLTIKELQGRLSRNDFRTGDPDKDGTLTKQEYLAILAERFQAADPDHDGTLDGRELSSPAGAALLRMVR